MNVIISWLVKNPILAACGAVVAALLVMLWLEKSAHSGTKADLLAAQTDLVTQQRVYNEAAAARNQAVSEALRRAGAEIEAQAQRNADLAAAVATQRQARENERIAADKRLAALEAVNEKLREWNNLSIPDDLVDWMLEPVASTVPAP